jgi:hypothetical protein
MASRGKLHKVQSQTITGAINFARSECFLLK